METYTINDNLTIQAEYYETRNNWGHKAYAYYNGLKVAEVKIVYQNRTWESYKYQSVMMKLIDAMDECKTIPLRDRIQAYKFIKTGDRRELRGLAMMGAMASMMGIIGGNDAKAGIIASIPGIDLPDDFATLTEEEKSKRLDGAINILTEAQA